MLHARVQSDFKRGQRGVSWYAVSKAPGATALTKGTRLLTLIHKLNGVTASLKIET